MSSTFKGRIVRDAAGGFYTEKPYTKLKKSAPAVKQYSTQKRYVTPKRSLFDSATGGQYQTQKKYTPIKKR